MTEAVVFSNKSVRDLRLIGRAVIISFLTLNESRSLMSKFVSLSYFDLAELFRKSMFSITKRFYSKKQTNGSYHKPG